MNAINGIVTAGVAMLAVALVAFAVGKAVVSLPVFGGDPNSTVAGAQTELGWNTTMVAIGNNASTAFSLLGISPLVIAVGLIVSILAGAFAYMYTRG